MGRGLSRLTALEVSKIKKPGLHHDGGGLYLQVRPAGVDEGGKPRVTRSWLYRYARGKDARGKPRTNFMGLGAVDDVTLAEARDRAAAARRLVRAGVDPIETREAERQRAAIEAAQAITFKACAEKFIASQRAGWSNSKHADQWTNTLATYAYPLIGKLSVSAVETGDVTRILEPIWTQKPETASRVRGRIEAVLDYAATHRWRIGENPARWRGHLENVLPKRSKVRRVEHHPALPWKDAGGFMADLAKEEGVAALALRFTILTAARTKETIGARQGEIDTKAAVWTIPAERMKGRKEHRVPLSEDALAVLRDVAKLREEGAEFVFPGGKRGKPLSNMAMAKLLERMGRDDITVHGFRSTFRDWAGETGKPADIAEAALAHTLGSKTQAAYQRGDLLERRRRLMDAWARYCASTPSADAPRGEVVTLAR